MLCAQTGGISLSLIRTVLYLFWACKACGGSTTQSFQRISPKTVHGHVCAAADMFRDLHTIILESLAERNSTQTWRGILATVRKRTAVFAKNEAR